MKNLKVNPEKLREEGNSVWRSVQVEPTILDEEERRVRGIVSTDQIDAYNTVVEPDGARVSGYMNYASVLFNHDSGSLIGNAEEVLERNSSIEAEWKFLPEGVSELADQVWELYKGGWLNGYSIGFVPLEWEDDTIDGLDIVRFTEWEMKEFSITSVPANAGALARNDEALEMFRSVQTNGSSSFYLNIQPRERDHINDDKSIEISHSSAWPDGTLHNRDNGEKETRTVPSFQDHPVTEVDEWDESRARDQIAKWAGGPDKEDIDWDKFKKGFFWYNGDEPENKTSYSFPYVYIRDGQPKAADRGIYAVASYLDQGDIPSDAKSKIRNQLEKYYYKLDETPPWEEDNTENIEVFNMDEEKMNQLAEKIGEEFSSRLVDQLDELKSDDKIDSLEERLADAAVDAEEAFTKADRNEDELNDLAERVETLTKAVNAIVDKIS